MSILYIMIHIPFFWWWKIGITGRSSRLKKRAKEIDAAVFGFPFPVMFVPVPNAYGLEQKIHRALRPLSCRFYRGDGSTEWFWFPAGLIAVGVSLLIWTAYIYLGYILFTYLT